MSENHDRKKTTGINRRPTPGGYAERVEGDDDDSFGRQAADLFMMKLHLAEKNPIRAPDPELRHLSYAWGRVRSFSPASRARVSNIITTITDTVQMARCQAD